MATYERNDRELSRSQVNRLLVRAVSDVGGVDGDWRAFYGGEVPSHDPDTGQRNSNAGEARPGYLRLACTAEGVTDQDVAALIDGWNVLPVVTDKAVIQADGVDTATVSLVYSSEDAGDTAVDYEVFLNGESIQTGVRAVSGATQDGLTTYTMTPFTFNTDTPGTYEVEVRRQVGHESGIVPLVAV